MEDGDSGTTVQMYLMSLNCTPQNNQNGQFYVMYIILYT